MRNDAKRQLNVKEEIIPNWRLTGMENPSDRLFRSSSFQPKFLFHFLFWIGFLLWPPFGREKYACDCFIIAYEWMKHSVFPKINHRVNSTTHFLCINVVHDSSIQSKVKWRIKIRWILHLFWFHYFRKNDVRFFPLILFST